MKVNFSDILCVYYSDQESKLKVGCRGCSEDGRSSIEAGTREEHDSAVLSKDSN